ncbi:MAG: hypothetical protein ACREQI_00755 [Candidatus Binataceae bacterium]
MPIKIATGRGIYSIEAAAPALREAGAIVLTLILKRADGIETVALRCRIAEEIAGSPANPDDLLARLAPWIEHEFEMTRELALKTIRSGHRMMELFFDAANRGPF